ncbi:MAG: glycosyltransferase family 39 protein [Holophagales bacterium]|nr:glycosyltransferase family 39 protein [Holophagales bacterium]
MTSVTEMADDPGASGRLLFVLAFLAGLLLRLLSLGSPDLFGPDEGAWAVGARNLVEGGLPQLLALSATPLGDASGMPVFFPAILALMVKTFGAYEWAIRLPSVFAGLVAAFVLERIVRRGYGQPAGHIAGAFAVLAPPLVLASRAATVEPMLTLLGLGGVIFGLRAFEEDSPGEAPLAGILFGLGFLTKGYAVGLFLLPLLVALLFRPRLFALGRTKRTLALLTGSFVLTAGLQFLLVALLRPETMAAHLARAFGSAPEALRQLTDVTLVSADLRLIVKTLFVLLPLVGVGIAYLTRPLGEEEIVSGATGGDRRLSHMALWCAYGVELVVLVAVAGSLELSSTPVLPALSALAGLGGAALLTRPRSAIRARFEMAATIASGTFVLLLAALLVATSREPFFDGGATAPLTAAGAFVAIVLCTAGAAWLASGDAARRFGRRVGPVFLSALLVSEGLEAARTIRHDLLAHRTGARALADQVAPALLPLPPRAVTFRAPEPDALAFRLFRTGITWSDRPTVDRIAEEARLGTTVVWAYRETSFDAAAAPAPLVRAWLIVNTREVTAEVDARAGRPTGLRVFVAAPPS